MTTRRDVVLHALAVILISAYPLSLMLRSNLGIVPVPFDAILMILAGNVVLVALLFVALRAVTKNVASRAAWLSVFLLAMGLYVAVIQQLSAMGAPIRADWPLVSLTYTSLCVVVATLVVRPRRERRRDPVPMLIIGAVLFGTNTMIGVSRAIALPSGMTGGRGHWQHAAVELIAQAMPADTPRAGAERDIYYIILDGFGRADTMTRLYDLELAPFVASLQARGFIVPERAAPNYVQTYLSIASALNLGYLDGMVEAVGTKSSDRSPLAYLIDRNALMQLAKRSGYQVIGIGSDFAATENMSGVDICRCAQYGSGTTEQALFAANPLATFVLGPRFFDAHRRKVLDAFDALQAQPEGARPSFVFAHILMPHPPFVFNSDGSPPDAFGPAMFQDGSHYPGSRADYRRGYRGQVEYLTSRLGAIIDSLLSRPGPPPAIVIHGDHGPGLRLNWESADQTDMAERTGIFAAYYFPNAATQAYATITPLNGARLLANNYFGTALPRLEDRIYFSTWGQPYDFIEVTGGGDR